MKHLAALTLAVVAITSVHAQVQVPGISNPSEEAKRYSNQQPITPEVLRELVGTWYEDYEELILRIGAAMGSSATDIEVRRAKLRAEQKENPPEPWVYIDGDQTFRREVEDRPMPLRIKKFSVELPDRSEGHATIYRMENRFYRGSHEMGAIPLTKQRPQ